MTTNTKLILSSNNQNLEIDLSRGGAITHLTLFSNGKSRKVICPKKGYDNESSLLFPFPNRLANGQFSFQGIDYQFPLNDYGRPNALHGFVKDMPFQVLQQMPDAITLQCTYTGDLEYYPFPFRMALTYHLRPGELHVYLEIENTGATTLPCGFGWHPYFHLEEGADSTSIELKNVSKIGVENLLPTGRATPYRLLDNGCLIEELDLDTCFEFSKKGVVNGAKIHYPDDATLEVWQDENQPYVQLYTPEDRRAIAIEPMTCNIDALNNQAGLKLLSSGESWSIEYGVRLY
ncbi:aldose 1-epimerase [Roseivirga misakiensis]|uniref:Aldose epimerase n=1 Tax=Roseivirga misakiensis TaxID=1563681 RepID=A0A1E5T7Z6_9BACT|nr:hypothetical protein [Roseivirga misakiensis]OEK07504.1 hypothetical protein BFP71_00425 [Roseivirga misakiensis]